LEARLADALARATETQADLPAAPAGDSDPPDVIGEPAPGDTTVLAFDSLLLDTRTREVHRGTRPIDLTPTEFRLLELLMRNARQVLTHDLLFDRIWGFEVTPPRSNTLRVYVGYLRHKTEAGGERRLIHTVRGVGYVFRT
jgi:two-component system response regulator MprA